jgi:hypothetical protein
VGCEGAADENNGVARQLRGPQGLIRELSP